MIKVINLTKSFSAQPLFDDINFNLSHRERLGLVGRNGHGKTTLFRLILGEEHPDAGEIVIPRDYSIGHVRQQIAFTRDTVIGEACLGLPPGQRDDKWQAEKILSGLGFATADMGRPPSEFSGGFQVRLNLARVLVSAPNLLLLDEPTNYLDIVSIRWLSKFLTQWPGELILITHDRNFMDGVTNHTMGIHRRKVRKIRGGTGKLYAQILKEEEIYEKTRINDEKKRKEMEIFISRFRAKARLANLVQSRIKSLEKKEKLDKLEKIKELDFSFSFAPFSGKFLMEAKDLTFSYGRKAPWLMEDFSITIGKKDRIAIIGKNGKGKTTLLRILAGELSPVRGSVLPSPNLEAGYFAQTNIVRLNDAKTVEEEIASSHPEGSRRVARDICGAMMFEGDAALKKVAVLSGGEKSRVLLGQILARPCNLLLLDEPTNHLDMESGDALLAAIDSFEGAVLIVTHNEMFLHALANRFIVFQGGRVFVHEGSYRSFLERVGWEGEEPAPGSGEEEAARPMDRKDLRRARADILTRRSRALKPLETAIAQRENAIEDLEAKLAEHNILMVEASEAGDGSRIAELAKKIHDSRESINTLYEELEDLILAHEKESNNFDGEMQGLSIDAG